MQDKNIDQPITNLCEYMKNMKEIKLIEKYNKEVVPEMKKKFGYKNYLSVPKLEKIVINIGAGRMSQQPNFQDRILPELEKELAAITAQKPTRTLSKKSISGFKLRQGQVIGLKVTVRGGRMYEFLDKLIRIIFPRVRDFRGIDLKNIDKTGNLSIGFKENVVFPEITPESSKVDFGLQITIVAGVKNKNEAIELYRLLGIPLKK